MPNMKSYGLILALFIFPLIGLAQQVLQKGSIKIWLSSNGAAPFFDFLEGCSGFKENNPKNQPNVILIFPDQMRANALGCMGNPDIKTPYLDALAAEGVLLQNTYSNTPVCCPARATIFTGKYAHANGMVTNDLRLRETEVSIAELFKDHGYETGFIGKWHLDGGPKEPGFIPAERRQGFEFWAANECNHNHFNSHYFRGNDTVPIPINEFEPKIWIDEAIHFLKNRGEKPFFLTIAPGPPHNPYVAPKGYQSQYDSLQITMPLNWQANVKNGSKKDLTGYYAMITAMDVEFGHLFQELAEQGLKENTIVLFISDHGDMLGSQGRIYKRQPWEESAKVPGIISWPGTIPKGKKTKTLFSTVDVLPTLLDLCGFPVPENVQGISIKNSILDDEPGPDCIYFEILGPCKWQGVESGWRGIRTKQYKYARYKHSPWIMYDLKNDPFELNNLVGNPDYADLKQELDNFLSYQMGRYGDSWGKNWNYPFADNFELQQFQAFYSIDDYFKWKNKQ